MGVLVFKTNIVNTKHVKLVSPHITSIEGVQHWNVDLHDIDKVLRVVADDLSPHYVEAVVQRAGYFCTELQG